MAGYHWRTMSKRETLLLLDGHALVYRAFFAIPALRNSRGELTNAAFGFTSMLLKALDQTRPSHVVSAFDLPEPTFRHTEDPTYKAHRPDMPDDLRIQLPWTQDVCRLLGIPIVEVAGFEADDIIGTLSQQAEAAGMDVVILTGDLDALQLVSDRTVVLSPQRGLSETVVYDKARVHERFGFDPPRMIDYKALCGDASDNIPGIPGIGDKTAKSLVAEYGDLEGVLAGALSMKPGRLRTLIEEHAEQARHSLYMATIRRDVEISFDPEASRLDAYDEVEVREFFNRLGFRSLLTRLPRFTKTATGDTAAVEVAVVESGSVTAGVEVLREPAATAEMVERWRKAGAVALRSVADAGGVVGVAIAGIDGRAVGYVPLGDTLGRATPEAEVMVMALLADPSVGKHAYDLKRELLLWRRRGGNMAGLKFDLMLAAYLVNTRTRVASLATLAHELCTTDIVEDDEFLGSGRLRRDFGTIDVDEVARHVAAGVRVMGKMEAALRVQLEAVQVTRLHDEMELPLVPIIAEMELAGVRVDDGLFGSISAELGLRIAQIEAESYRLAGREFNLASTKQLAVILYDDLGLASGRKTKTGRSTNAETLEALREEHPLVGLLLEWRQLTKLKNTYVDVLPLLCDKSHRVHTSFHQAVAATGRLSSSDPNLQNIPIRTPWGLRIRAGFVADPGTRLVSADYSQIELRVLAHLSGEDELVAAFQRGEDVHRRTAAEVYGVDPDLVSADMRRVAKVVNFGVLYGLGDFGLSRDTGMSREESGAFIANYFASFPKVTAYLESVRQQAREHGWVETLMGRRRYLPDIHAASGQLRKAAERMAVNMPMQGSSADIMKVAMIRADAALRKAGLVARVLLQVHDELVVEAPNSEVDTVVTLLRDAMGGAATLLVPLDVDVKVGDNWAEMKGL